MMDDARRQEKTKDLYRSRQVGRQRRVFMRAGLMLLAVTVLSVGSVGVTLADDQPPPVMMVGYQNGTITAIDERTFDVDGRTYGLLPDVVLRDEEGTMLEPGSLVVTAEVKFHIKKEQNDNIPKIDKMIVTRPR
ncbi:MAG: hypothetical protein SGJ16_09985 [Nitrospirota bacterium]|nr:hypothetical protein [Nitrospirota bacterium]